MEQLRQQYQALQTKIPFSSFWQDKRLRIVAQRFALAGAQILTNVYEFESEQLDDWLQKLVEYGNRNRENVKQV